MEATKYGIFLNKPELAAVLAFTGEGGDYSVVHFQVNGSSKLKVGATDGRKSVECIAKADGAVEGEWAVDREYLDKRRRSMDGATELMRMEVVAGGAVRLSLVLKENGKEKEGTKWSTDVASTQISLSKIEKDLKTPKSRDYTGSWCAIDPDEVSKCLRRMKIATEDCPITEWPPTAPDKLKHYECSGEGGRWVAAFKPVEVVAPGEQADEEEDEEATAPGRRKRASDRQLDLEEHAKAKRAKAKDAQFAEVGEEEDEDDDTVISDEEARALKENADFIENDGATEKKRGRGGRKKAR